MPVTKETDKWGTISQAVDSWLMDLGEDRSRFEQGLHWCLEGARDWHFDQARQVKTDMVKMTGYKAIKYPKDMVDWVKVGIKSGDRIYTFTRDNSIALHHDCEDGELIDNPPNQDSVFADPELLGEVGYFFYGNALELPLYGLAVKDNGLGYYSDHPEQKEIQLATNLPSSTKIYLEYISDGWDPNKETLLHPYAFKLIKLYAHWMNLKYNRSVPRSHVQEAKQEYWDEHDRVSWRMFPLTVEDVLEVSREAFMSSPQN